MINQNKMTAVEWLQQQQKELLNQVKSGEFKIEDFEYYNALYIEQAKAMERKQSLNINEYDLDKLAINYSKDSVSKNYPGFVMQSWEKEAVEDFKAGFQKALELLTFKSE